MALALLTFIAAYAAIFLWLIVRTINRRERWAKYTLAVMFSLPVYFLSIGPALWLQEHKMIPGWAAPLEWIYLPIWLMAEHGPEPIPELILWYGELWVD